MSGDGGIVKLPTHINGFDLIADGGLPEGRVTLVSGTSGSAKTVFAAQFLADGIVHGGEPGVFVTFEEPAEDIRSNILGFGWDVAEWEAAGLWSFVDASSQADEPAIVAGPYDLDALLARIEHAIRKVNAKRVSIDSIGGLFAQFDDANVVRRALLRIARSLKRIGVTAIITAEREEESGPVGRFGVEDFVSDNVVILRNSLSDELRRRTVEILKFRGTHHQKGEWPFTIVPGEGIVVIPLSALELKQKSSGVRISSGTAELDSMCGGGFFRDSIILVSGPTGTGKTLLTTQFLGGGIAAGERTLLFAFEESREQLMRNALGWGIDFGPAEAEGKLKIVCRYPEATALEDHLIAIKRAIDDFQPERVAIDSLSALERVSSLKGFREFAIGVTSYIKHREIPGVFTATTSSLLGGSSITETHISSTTDSIILLRYVESRGQMRRGVAVLKMRGSAHDKEIREFTIDGDGIHIGAAFREVQGILSGYITHASDEGVSHPDGVSGDGAAGYAPSRLGGA